MIRASGADDDVAPYPRLLSRKLRFLVSVDKRIGDRLISVHLPVLAEQMNAIWHEADSPG